METLVRTLGGSVLILLLFMASVGAVEAPNQSRPVIQSPGGSISITVEDVGQLFLVKGENRYLLSPIERHATVGGVQLTCPLPDTIPEGIYALQVKREAGVEQREGAVVILNDFPETVGGWVDDTPTLWLKLSDTITLSIPLPEKGKSRAYEERYGALPFTVELGDYGLMVFDGHDTRESTLAQLYTLRRTLKAKTWTLALSTTPCLQWPFRTQLILLDDDPVDLLLTPEPMPADYAGWPRTRFLAYPPKDNPVHITPDRINTSTTLQGVEN